MAEHERDDDEKFMPKITFDDFFVSKLHFNNEIQMFLLKEKNRINIKIICMSRNRPMTVLSSIICVKKSQFARIGKKRTMCPSATSDNKFFYLLP